MAIVWFQYQGALDEQKTEIALLKQQVGSERTSVNNLESLLQTNREKEFQSQLTVQEMQSDNQLLRDRLAINDSKLSVAMMPTPTRTCNSHVLLLL